MPPAAPHNALPRVLAFYHYWRKIYGMSCARGRMDCRINGGRHAAGLAFLIWFGPMPRLTVAEPELGREIFLTRAEALDRYEAHPVVRQLESDRLVSPHGDNAEADAVGEGWRSAAHKAGGVEREQEAAAHEATDGSGSGSVEHEQEVVAREEAVERWHIRQVQGCSCQSPAPTAAPALL
uniref:Uncharacterized protein n=1 Tax=Oryza barthii TaxID=65489 RepID=A0A0D3HMK2_9ORYZ